MSIIQLLKALVFTVRMLCNLAELAVTICVTLYLLPRAGRNTQVTLLQ